MLPPQECRLLVDSPQTGTCNMAVDEVLLNSGIGGIATLRFYEWSAPTISLGHFQNVQGQITPERFAGLASVKRLSGGGAILHHYELTYSCVLPQWHPITRDPGTLYDLVHAVILEVLHRRNVDCRLRGDDAFADQSFLCFSRGDARDIVSGAHKIVGSAQRRRQGTILQHGSILLKKSEYAPEFPGIFELSGQSLAAEELIPELSTGILQRLELNSVPGTLTPDEHQAVQGLISQ